MEIKESVIKNQFESIVVAIAVLFFVAYIRILLIPSDRSIIPHEHGQITTSSNFTSYTFTIAAIIITLQIATFVHYQSTLTWALTEFDTKIKNNLHEKSSSNLDKELKPIIRSLGIPRLSSAILSLLFCCVMLNFALAPFTTYLKYWYLKSLKNPELLDPIFTELKDIELVLNWQISVPNLLILFILSALSTQLTPVTDIHRNDLEKIDQTVNTINRSYRYSSLFGNGIEKKSTRLFSQSRQIDTHFTEKISKWCDQISAERKGFWQHSTLIAYIIVLDLIFYGACHIFNLIDYNTHPAMLAIYALAIFSTPYLLLFSTITIFRSSRGKFVDAPGLVEFPIIGVSLMALSLGSFVLIAPYFGLKLGLIFFGYSLICTAIPAAFSIHLTLRDWRTMSEELRLDYLKLHRYQDNTTEITETNNHRSFSTLLFHSLLGLIFIFIRSSAISGRSHLPPQPKDEDYRATPEEAEGIGDLPRTDSPLNLKFDDRCRRLFFVYNNNADWLQKIKS